MQAGKLVHVIEIQSLATSINEAGTPEQSWTKKATLRAELVTAEAEEFIRGWGASEETAVVFRARWLDGVTLADRVVFDGQAFNIKSVVPLGRRRGLELRCTGEN
ncbi:phage head closure protein [Cereibacter sphaeroides]|uniref:phage head closure protein n=1 Tax=Cereibacter sphaeroides TaxID=1063 RepID=UPI003AF04136